MSRIISRAESYTAVYEAFSQVNFSAFDYDTVKESLVEYIKLYFPETFNDFIESSEFIAVLEMFAYIAELLAYRYDLNATENFISIADRKASVLRLAKLIAYNPSRNIPARGLVKITSIQTTEQVFDALGRDLTGRRIIWNDFNNEDWKDQFILIMNRVLAQDFGTVTPRERRQIDDVLFELYDLENNTLSNGVFRYSASVSGQGVPMELVPAQLGDNGICERRPANNASFSLLFGSDGLGDASDTTGFFCFTKQGSLTSERVTFDGVTPNQTFEIETLNVNNIDLYLNNIDPTTGETLDDRTVPGQKSGEWIQVDIANAQNIIFNTNANRNKYEVETLEEDRVRLIFGDGEFANIPSGTFELWRRSSLDQTLVIPQNTVVDQVASFTYQDFNNNVQTFTFTFSLINTLQNASPSEDIDHIRRIAPSVYYTQERMVNARDYNTFMLQDPTILKLRAVNRTFTGESKYMDWNDPREYYDNVKIFGDDAFIYFDDRNTPETGTLERVSTPATADELIVNYLQPLLASTDFFVVLSCLGLQPRQIKREFENVTPISYAGQSGTNSSSVTDTEVSLIGDAISTTNPVIRSIYYSMFFNEYTVGPHPNDASSIWMIEIVPVFGGTSVLQGWDIIRHSKRQIIHSQATRFWNINDPDKVIDYDSIDPDSDKVVLLQANPDVTRNTLLPETLSFDIIAQERVEPNLPNAGLPNINKVVVLPTDTNQDGVPDGDGLVLPTLLNPTESYTITGTAPQILTLPSTPFQRTYLAGRDDEIEVTLIDGTGRRGLLQKANPDPFTDTNGWQEPDASSRTHTQVVIPSAVLLSPPNENGTTTQLGAIVGAEIKMIDYVYFERWNLNEEFFPSANNDTTKEAWALDQLSATDDQVYRRFAGRDMLNFAWFHFTPRFNLVDPAATNIIDMFIITRGYHTAYRRYIKNLTSVEPEPPTSLDLRNSYAKLLDNKMISDTVILHSGEFKLLFGARALPELQATLKIIRSPNALLTDNEVRVRVVDLVEAFFDINVWEFGETFYFTELAAFIHLSLAPEIDSVVLVPDLPQNQFGDLFQVFAREIEIIQPDISVNDIEIVENYTVDNLRQNESTVA